MEGFLVLIGLAVLAIPVLLVIALVQLATARGRIAALEHSVALLQAQAQSRTRHPATDALQAQAQTQQAQTPQPRQQAAPAAAQAAATPVAPTSAPSRATNPEPTPAFDTAAAAPVREPSTTAPATISDTAGIAPDALPTPAPSPAETDADIPATPPPLPWERAVSIGATAAQEQDEAVARAAAARAARAASVDAARLEAARAEAARTQAAAGAGVQPGVGQAASARAAAAPPAQRWQAPPREPDLMQNIADGLRNFFTHGNVPVKIGMLVLLAGVAALLKYAADQGWFTFPIELRLAGIAAAGIAALGFGWVQRARRPSFALAVQGGAVGVLMLTTFAAFKLYALIPAGAAFAITILLVAGLGVLAVVQNTRTLAVLGLLSGFMAPLWLSTGSGNHIALFSYYAVLNVAIFAIAVARSWRVLNLLGFIFTFGIGTLWGVLRYTPQDYASGQGFLLLFATFYLLIPIFYARMRNADVAARGQRSQRAYGAVDGTLVFGTPLVGFALQAGLLDGARMPLALSALVLAAVYALIGFALRGRHRFQPLVDAYAVLAVGFATLAVPLALSAQATASVFALEGAALIWLGLRQERLFPQIIGAGLQAAAAVAFAIGFGMLDAATLDALARGLAAAKPTPIANATTMGALLIAIAGLASAWCYERARPDTAVAEAFALWGLGWWSFAGMHEIQLHLSNTPHAWDAVLGFLALTAWLCAEGGQSLRLRVFALATVFGLAMGLPMALLQTGAHDWPLAGWGAAAWLAYAALGARTLHCLRAHDTVTRGFAHAGWLWAWMGLVLISVEYLLDRAKLGGGWEAAGWLLPLALGCWLLLRPQAGPWAAPLRAGFADYHRPLALSFAVALAVSWCVSLLSSGASAPLPWVSVLNPLELSQLLALGLLASVVWGEKGAPQRNAVVGLGLVMFVWITVATLRACHHWGDVAWSPTMIADDLVQTALTVVWSVLGVLGWILGSRRGERALWGVGAGLMAVVLVKLVLIDRQYLGNLNGIASFIGYGLLCTAVGYFAPAPPRRERGVA